MQNMDFEKVANKLIAIEDKISEAKKIANVLSIWIKDNNYELIPVINILNNKIDDIVGIIEN